MSLERQVLQSRYSAEPVHSGDELALLARRFPNEITLHTATCEGNLVAGVVVYETPVLAHAQYLAASEEDRRVHALDKIVDMLRVGYESRIRWWDFGTSTERSGQYLNEALMRNKESYGARAVVYDQYVLDLQA
jgi:hypothetical protein